MPTVVAILTLISMIHTTSERFKARDVFICQYFTVNLEIFVRVFIFAKLRICDNQNLAKCRNQFIGNDVLVVNLIRGKFAKIKFSQKNPNLK